LEEFKKMTEQPQRAPLQNSLETGGLCCPNVLSCFLGTIFPCAWFGACSCVDEKTEKVLLYYGKYHGVIREPGCYCWNPYGVNSRLVSTARVAIDLVHVKVADGKGNPLLVSGVVTYEIIDARRAALDVPLTRSFVNTQGLAVMKKIASMYPYEAKEGEHSLKSEAAHLRSQMINMLQDRVTAAGVKIFNFELTDLAYAPEIAQAMLIRQQAEAMVDARKIIVEGAVAISYGALVGLGERNLQLSVTDQSRLVSSLLTVICGDSKVQPQLSVGL